MLLGKEETLELMPVSSISLCKCMQALSFKEIMQEKILSIHSIEKEQVTALELGDEKQTIGGKHITHGTNYELSAEDACHVERVCPLLLSSSHPHHSCVRIRHASDL